MGFNPPPPWPCARTVAGDLKALTLRPCREPPQRTDQANRDEPRFRGTMKPKIRETSRSRERRALRCRRGHREAGSFLRCPWRASESNGDLFSPVLLVGLLLFALGAQRPAHADPVQRLPSAPKPQPPALSGQALVALRPAREVQVSLDGGRRR